MARGGRRCAGPPLPQCAMHGALRPCRSNAWSTSRHVRSARMSDACVVDQPVSTVRRDAVEHMMLCCWARVLRVMPQQIRRPKNSNIRKADPGRICAGYTIFAEVRALGTPIHDRVLS